MNQRRHMSRVSRGSTGPTGTDYNIIASAITARLSLASAGRPKRGMMEAVRRNDKRSTKASRLWKQEFCPELSFALVDADRNILKFSMMTYATSFERNNIMKGSGFAWVRCDQPIK